MSDWETLKAKIARDAGTESPDWETLRAQLARQVEPKTEDPETQGADFQSQAPERNRETPKPQIVPGAEPRERAGKPAKPEIAAQVEPQRRNHNAPTPQLERDRVRAPFGEAEPRERNVRTLPVTRESILPAVRGRMADRVHPLVFGLVGLLLVSQVYTWVRLEQSLQSDKQRERQLSDVQAALQKDVEKQMAALDQAYQQAAHDAQAQIKDLEHTYETTFPRGREIWKPKTTAPTHEEPRQTQVAQKLQGGRQSVSTTGASTSAGIQHSTAVVAQTSRPREASNSGQTLYAVQSRPSANDRDLTSPQPSLDAKKSDPRDQSAVSSAARPGRSRAPIARNHAELEKLEKLGERDYVEFTLLRSSIPQEVVPGISLKLVKTDARASHCRISVYADDYELPVNQALDDPVSFPIRAGWQSVDLVVNEIEQDRVLGYLSAAKGVLIAR